MGSGRIYPGQNRVDVRHCKEASAGQYQSCQPWGARYSGFYLDSTMQMRAVLVAQCLSLGWGWAHRQQFWVTRSWLNLIGCAQPCDCYNAPQTKANWRLLASLDTAQFVLGSLFSHCYLGQFLVQACTVESLRPGPVLVLVPQSLPS